MPIKKESVKGFVKGLIAVANRFSAQKGSNLLMSNLLMNERGALQTCDGTLPVSVLPGGNTNSIITLGTFVDPVTFISRPVGLVENTATKVDLYDFSTNPATLLIASITRDSGWHSCQLFNFAGSMVITLGPGSLAQLYTEPSGTPTLTALTSTNAWQANRIYQVGDIVDAGNGYAYQALNLSTYASAGYIGNVTMLSGNAPPTWPLPSYSNTNANVPAFDQVHPTVTDNTIVWRLIGGVLAAGGGGNTNSMASYLLPPGAAHGISHQGFLWFFGTDKTENVNGADGPMSLRQSHLNVPNEWPSMYSAYIGKDDGQPATGIGSFTIAEAGIAPQGGLVLFKEYSTYNVTANFGSGPSVFSIQPVKTDMGCIAPRSVQWVPGYGIMRLTHMGVSLYDGTQDRIVSEDVRPYIFGGFGITGINQQRAHHSRSAIVVNPPLYIIAIPTVGNDWCSRLLCYDLILQAWTVVDLPFQISSLFQVRLSNVVEGTYSLPTVYMGGSSDGIVRRWQAGDQPLWDGNANAPVNWSLTTPEIGGDATGRLYFRRTTVRLHAPQTPQITLTPIYGSRTGAPNTKTAVPINPISFGPSSGGNQGQQAIGTYEGETDYIVRFTQGVTGQTERVTVAGTGRVTLEAIELDIVPRPAIPLGQPV